MRWTVGQIVHLVTKRNGEPERGDHTITSIGRIYGHLDDPGHSRFYLRTGVVVPPEGYVPHQHVYASAEAYDAERALEKAWDALVERMYRCRYHPPIGMTLEKIKTLTSAMFPTEEKDPHE